MLCPAVAELAWAVRCTKTACHYSEELAVKSVAVMGDNGHTFRLPRECAMRVYTKCGIPIQY
jgi:hypothetical protein